MTFEFDGEKYKRASAQQKTWGKVLICELELAGRYKTMARALRRFEGST